MKETTLFSKMPSSSIFARKNFLEEFKKEIEKIYNTSEEKDLKNIANMIYDRISSDDLDYRFTREEYGCFRNVFSKVKMSRIEILYSSIEMCLKVSNTEIYNELKSFSKDVDWYPFRGLIKDKNTNQNVFSKKDISLGDCFLVVNNLGSYIIQFIEQQATKYLQMFGLIDNIDDMVIFIEQLKNNQDIKDSVMIEFDNKFSFLEKYSLFKDIYYCVNDTLMERLCQMMYIVYSLEKDKEIRKKKAGLGRGASEHALKLGKWQKISERKRNKF